MLNNIFKFFNWISFWFMIVWDVLICQVRRTSFIYFMLAIFSIIFYCGVECGFAFNEVEKLSNGSFYNGNRSLEFWKQILIPPGASNRVDTFKSIKDFISESGSSIIEFFSFFLFTSDDAVEKSSKEGSEDNSEDSIYFHIGLVFSIIWIFFHDT